MFERLGKDARAAVLDALQRADVQGTQVGAPHLLLAVVSDATCTGARLLAQHGVTAACVRASLAAGTSRAGLSDADLDALRTLGIDADEVFRRLEAVTAVHLADPVPQPRRWLGLGGPFDAAVNGVLQLSVREANVAGHPRVGTEHLLLALLQHIEAAAPWVPAPLSTLFAERAVGYEAIRQRIHAGQRRAG
jgi:hypothetical protein